MSLSDRMWGYELSEIEKELIFRRENIGFVTYEHESGRVFRLDPSPFLKSTKREYFLALDCQPPPEGKLVEVEVIDVEERLFRDSIGLVKYTVKKIGSWKEIDPASLIRKRGLITRDDYLYYFSLPYHGSIEVVETVAFVSSLFPLSSPPIDEKIRGGIQAGVFGKKNRWSGFYRSMRVVPREFQRYDSPYFYRIASREERISVAAREVNLGFLNPINTPFHVPIPLEPEVKRVQEYESEREELLPLVRAYVLQGLLLSPTVGEEHARLVRESIYRVHDTIRELGLLPPPVDVGTLVHRVVASLARLDLEPVPKNVHFKEAIEYWERAYEMTVKICSLPIAPSAFYRLTKHARVLYMELIERGAVDNPVPEAEVIKNTKLGHYYEFAIEELLKRGLVIFYRVGGRRCLEVVDIGRIAGKK